MSFPDGRTFLRLADRKNRACCRVSPEGRIDFLNGVWASGAQSDMKNLLQLLIMVPTVIWTGVAMAAPETKVVINLSEQKVYLVEQGRVALVSPIAPGSTRLAYADG